eukprot:GEMP01092974.1.p3 GENE.GEMP01092974.1~~GEMP01092974.1.p3  ORF type:complete len:115 (+),score=27.73 GEMP01092974.1:543-887(+)
MRVQTLCFADLFPKPFPRPHASAFDNTRSSRSFAYVTAMGLKCAYTDLNVDAFTHWAGWKNHPDEKKTLDFIFHRGFETLSVLDAPRDADVPVDYVYPNETHPSDHIAIVADVT